MPRVRSEKEKARSRQRAKEWREANTERYRRQMRDWYEKNKTYQRAKSLHQHYKGRRPELTAKYYQVIYRWRNGGRLREKDREYYQQNRTRVIERVVDRQKQETKRAQEKFREFVASLPDVYPTLPTPKSQQRREILTALDAKLVRTLRPKPSPPKLSGRPRRLWRRLSRRGLPQNDGARP